MSEPSAYRAPVLDQQLDKLEMIDPTNRPLVELVHTFRAARAHFFECDAMIREELTHFRIP